MLTLVAPLEELLAAAGTAEQKPARVIERYSERWAIENEGVRELSQRWRARVPIGRSFSAIYAQLVMLVLCYNAMKDYAMKRPKEAEAVQAECRRRARRSYLAGQAVILSIPRRRIYGGADAGHTGTRTHAASSNPAGTTRATVRRCVSH